MHREIEVDIGEMWAVPIDEGIVDLVRLLNQIPNIKTVSSCQGATGHMAYIHFVCGDWREVSQVVFGVLEPAVHEMEDIWLDCGVHDWQGRRGDGHEGTSNPIGSIAFWPGATSEVTEAIRTLIGN